HTRSKRDWSSDVCSSDLNDRDQRGADVPEENDADERYDNALLDQLFAKCADRAFDQIAAVVSRHDPHAIGQRRFDLFDLLFDSIDHVERVLAVPHDDDAADGLTTA